MNNYLPFNLETALAQPHRVVTRDGRKVTEIFHAKTVEDEAERVIAVIGGEYFMFHEDGRFLSLLPETREVWVNVYREGGARWHETKELADAKAKFGRIACVKVTIEVP